MDKVIKKLQKLIAHEKSARAIKSTAEAAAFAERIQQLLSKHNLSMSQVELHAARKSPIDMEPVQEDVSTIENWQRALLNNIAQINGCHALEHGLGFQIVVGRQRDREIVISLFRYFEKLGLELADSFINDRYKAMSAIYVGFTTPSFLYSDPTRRNSFLLGFVTSVCKRLDEISKKNQQESDNSVALVFLGNRQKENKDWIDAKLNVTEKNVEVDKNLDRSAFISGASVGESVALTDKSLR